MTLSWRVLAPALVIASVLVRMTYHDQWDFEIYYFAALAERHGVTPYDANNLTALTHGTTRYLFPFMYPPPAAWLFAPFTWLSMSVAKAVWLALKLGVLVALMWLWQSRFMGAERSALSGRKILLWAILVAVAFNSTVFREIRSGNFELITQLLIWLGLAAWLDRRWATFTALIVAAAFFKLTPLLLLALLFVDPAPRNERYVVGGLVAFAALLTLSWLSAPDQFHQWIANVSRHDDEAGMTNPCLLAFLRELASGLSLEKRFADIAYLIAAAGLLIGAINSIRRAHGNTAEDRRELILYFALLTYAIVLPRFMVYAYVLLLIPTWFVAVRGRYTLAILLALFVAHDVVDKLLSTPINPTSPFWQHQSELALRGVWLGYVVTNYFPFFCALGIWVLYRRALRAA